MLPARLRTNTRSGSLSVLLERKRSFKRAASQGISKLAARASADASALSTKIAQGKEKISRKPVMVNAKLSDHEVSGSVDSVPCQVSLMTADASPLPSYAITRSSPEPGECRELKPDMSQLGTSPDSASTTYVTDSPKERLAWKDISSSTRSSSPRWKLARNVTFRSRSRPQNMLKKKDECDSADEVNDYEEPTPDKCGATSKLAKDDVQDPIEQENDQQSSDNVAAKKSQRESSEATMFGTSLAPGKFGTLSRKSIRHVQKTLQRVQSEFSSELHTTLCLLQACSSCMHHKRSSC